MKYKNLEIKCKYKVKSRNGKKQHRPGKKIITIIIIIITVTDCTGRSILHIIYAPEPTKLHSRGPIPSSIPGAPYRQILEGNRKGTRENRIWAEPRGSRHSPPRGIVSDRSRPVHSKLIRKRKRQPLWRGVSSRGHEWNSQGTKLH